MVSLIKHQGATANLCSLLGKYFKRYDWFKRPMECQCQCWHMSLESVPTMKTLGDWFGRLEIHLKPRVQAGEDPVDLVVHSFRDSASETHRAQ